MTRDIVVIGASAGGVEALMSLATAFPRDLGAAVLIVLHIPSHGSVLPKLLQRVGKLPVAHAVDGEPLRTGRIYVAPPDHHLVVHRGAARLAFGPKENNHRPSIDVLFRTAAWTYGPRVIGVLLTGRLDDGAAGLDLLKREGGYAIVQDPEDAHSPDMPRAALSAVDVDRVLPLAAIAAHLSELVGSGEARLVDPEAPGVALGEVVIDNDGRPVPVADDEGEVVSSTRVMENGVTGQSSGLICPSCSGSLWDVRGDGPMRFRCRVGHAFSAESMLAGQEDTVENALWAALRALEEQRDLVLRLHTRAVARGHTLMTKRFQERVTHIETQAEQLRQLLRRRARGAPTP
jgi:two-component system chemotaxis response regulator CheB